jgi:uncharacterized protein YndB with AHSA1/START domain
MASTDEAPTTTVDLVVTRVFDVPVERVWNAWSDSELVQQWWGPVGFTAPVARMDFREGGSSLVCMRSPDGHDLYNTWTYRSIVPMQRIEFIMTFADEHGGKVDPAALGLPPGVPQDVRHVVTFEELGDGRTELTVTEYGYAPGPVVEVSKLGLEQCLDKMAAALARAAEEPGGA